VKSKQWCSGAGQFAHRDAAPSSLVTCPVCNRKGLNGEEPRSAGLTTYEAYDEAAGEYRLVVPRHAAKKTQPGDIGQASFPAREPYDSREWGR
jgi:hypothetical protein